MTLEFEIEGEDLRALVRALRRTPEGRHQIWYEYSNALWLALIPLIVVGGVLVMGKSPLVSYALLVAAPLVTYALVWSVYYRYLLNLALERRAAPPSGVGLGRHQLRLSADGIHEVQPYGEAHHRWSVVQQVLEGPEHLFVGVLPGGHYIVPKRAFANREDQEAFRRLLLRGAGDGSTPRRAGEQADGADERRSR